MDTSETYTKMCEKAEEIQEAKPQRLFVGDVLVLPEAHGTPRAVVLWNGQWRPDGSEIWLPRQDQLQEMLGYCGASDIHGWLVRITLFQRDNPYQSMEQLWLACVMKVKYNKVWDDKDWISG